MAPSRTGLGAALAIVLVTVVVAGCIGTTGEASETQSVDDAATEAPPSSSALPGPFTLRACAEQFGLFTIPASDAEPYLPDGFELTGLSGTPLPEGTAHLVVLAYTCDEDGVAVTEFSADLVVEPPEAVRNDDAGDHYINVVGVTTSASTLDAYHAWGLTGMQEGEVGIDAAADTPLAGAWGSHAAQGSAEARMTTSALGPPTAASGGEVRIFGVEDRKVTGALDITWTDVEGGYGEAAFQDEGLVPVATEEVGLGGSFWGFDETFRPVALPP